MSEPLKISEIIEQLTAIKEEHGDIKVGTWSDGILKFIRSAQYIKAENTNNEAVALQWWEE